MWELDYKGSWALKNCCFWTVVLEKTLESPLNCKDIKPVNPEGNQSWIFIGRTDAEAEAAILWPPDVKNWLIGKDPDAGKDWRQEKKGRTGDEMVGWHHWLDGHEFEQPLEVGDGQGNLACCSPWDSKESVTTEWWWIELNQKAKTQVHTTVHRHKPLPPGSLYKPLYQPHSPGADTRSKETMILWLAELSPQIQVRNYLGIHLSLSLGWQERSILLRHIGHPLQSATSPKPRNVTKLYI